MHYPADMDPECQKICDVLNAFLGTKTFESCCGHDRKPFRIFFTTSSLEELTLIARCIELESWSLEVALGSGASGLYFVLEGPAMACAGDQLAEIVENMRQLYEER